MTLENCNSLNDQEKENLLAAFDQGRIEDLEAEKNSFKTELEQLKEEYKGLLEDNRKTKELNFTLGRKLDVSSKHESAEDVLHNMFKRG